MRTPVLDLGGEHGAKQRVRAHVFIEEVDQPAAILERRDVVHEGEGAVALSRAI
jgi:hypothetical protein